MNRVNPLKKWIEKKGWTREQFADAVGLSTPFAIDLVNGKNADIKVSNLRKIHEVTGIKESDLVDWLLREVDAHHDE